MNLIPTLEILGGNVVRLIGGADGEAAVLSDDPVRVARDLRRAGAKLIHIVDVDALLSNGHNNRVLQKLSCASIPFQVRGGVRSVRRAAELLRLGARRIVLGDLPFQDWSAARSLVRQFGLHVIATLDVYGEQAVVEGATRTTLDLDRALTNVLDSGVEHVIYNSVGAAGEDAYIDHSVLHRLMMHGTLQIHARCTVQTPDELFPLIDLEHEGLQSVILNQSLATDSATFAQLVQCAGAGMSV